MTIAQLVFSFDGRINRAKYWLVIVMVVIASWIIGLLVSPFTTGPMFADYKVAVEKCQSVTDPKAKNDCIAQNMPMFSEMETAQDKCQQVVDSNAQDLCMRQLAVQTMKYSWMSKASLIMLPFYIIYTWIMLAIGAKRLHDRNLSGWWQGVPYVGSFILMAWILVFLPTAMSSVAFLKVVLVIITTIASIAGVVLFITCGFLKGTSGPNRFGADPINEKIA